MFKKQVQAETQPEQPGRLADLRAEVQRLAAALTPKPGSATAIYQDLERQLSELRRASQNLSQPFDVDQEIRISAIKHRLEALEPLLEPERPEIEKAFAEFTAASDALKEAEKNVVFGRIQLALFDQQTRRLCAERDWWRARRVAELNTWIGGPTQYPAPLDLSKIT